ncbi:MAG TPA: hypothetical protein VMU25_04645 [Candidatus Paceibacterota bacterium]|nr:hypothetical protein [Candidatus Paceibacterota bacterium]
MRTTTYERRITVKFAKGLWQSISKWLLGMLEFDNPGKYYMRGPGPAWHKKRGLPYPPKRDSSAPALREHLQH